MFMLLNNALQPMPMSNGCLNDGLPYAEIRADYTGLFGRTQLVEQQLEALYQISKILGRPLALPDKLQQALDMLQELGIISAGLAVVRDGRSERDGLAFYYPKYLAGMDSVQQLLNDELIATVMANGSPVAVRSIANESLSFAKQGGFVDELPFVAVPIKLTEHSVAGVLAIQPSDRHFLTERTRFAEMIANLVAESLKAPKAWNRAKNQLTEQAPPEEPCLPVNHGFAGIAGRTPIMLRVFEQVRQVAKWNTTVLLCGESGTGKELIANAIHRHSACADGPFIKLNCPALADSLLESELFGHEKGAFSGAVSQRKGRFELANQGTIFLDEIGEISLDFQTKLLRVLQEGEFERVGGKHTLKVRVRVIAATNRNLEAAVRDGGFREDLYYRLNVMPINIPALRERLDDIPELVEDILARLSKRQGGRRLEIKESAIRLLMNYDWPGNVRELENRLERACIMSPNGIIDQDAIAMTDLGEGRPEDAPNNTANAKASGGDEREQIIAALERTGWVQAKAARLLNMTPRQIAYRIMTMNIQMKHI